MADYHLKNNGRGFHVQGGFGVARTTFLYSTLTDSSGVDGPDAVHGGTFMIGAGYDFTRVIGLLLRAGYSHLNNADSHFRPITGSVLMSFTLR